MSQVGIDLRLRTGQLHSWRFDGFFVLGIAAVALATAVVLGMRPDLFGILLLLDLWALGYHHVIATFTRFAGDPANAARNRFLIFVLPLIVAGANVGLWSIGGVGLITGIYFYWLVFHYARQCWGISSAYGRKAARDPDEPAWLVQGVIYLMPLWGLAHRSAEHPTKFLGADVLTIPVSPVLSGAIGVVAVATLFLWAGYRVRAALRGQLAGWQTLFLATHAAIFAVGYVWMPDINHGWLVVNIWHNAQYLAFVWLANQDRYRAEGANPTSLMARLSQPGAAPLYVLLCLSTAIIAYAALIQLSPALILVGLPVLLLYQTINFHHYIVDAVVWRRRRPAHPLPA